MLCASLNTKVIRLNKCFYKLCNKRSKFQMYLFYSHVVSEFLQLYHLGKWVKLKGNILNVTEEGKAGRQKLGWFFVFFFLPLI